MPDEDTDTEVNIDEEEKQWAYALARENLLDSDMNEKLVLVDILSKLKEENKKLGKLFKNQKEQYRDLSELVQKEENIIKMSKKNMIH